MTGPLRTSPTGRAAGAGTSGLGRREWPPWVDCGSPSSPWLFLFLPPWSIGPHQMGRIGTRHRSAISDAERLSHRLRVVRCRKSDWSAVQSEPKCLARRSDGGSVRSLQHCQALRLRREESVDNRKQCGLRARECRHAFCRCCLCCRPLGSLTPPTQRWGSGTNGLSRPSFAAPCLPSSDGRHRASR